MTEAEGELIRAGAEVLTEPAKQFLSSVTGSPGEEIGESFADRIRFRRFKSQVRMVERAREMYVEHGLDPQAVPIKVIAPLLEGVSLEDDGSMIDRWAALLANAATDPDAVPPSFAEILKEISAMEAAILDDIYRLVIVEGHGPDDDFRNIGVADHALKNNFGLDDERFNVYIDNLLRLGVCAPRGERLGFTNRPQIQFATESKDRIRLTDLGRAFVRACRPPGEAVAR